MPNNGKLMHPYKTKIRTSVKFFGKKLESCNKIKSSFSELMATRQEPWIDTIEKGNKKHRTQ